MANEIINSINDFLEKARVYLPEGQQAPQGINIQQGKRGGKYYESQGRERAAQEQVQPQVPPVINPEVHNIPQTDIDIEKIKSTPLSERAIRAKESYKPATREVQEIADKKELEISQVVGGERTGDNLPFDVIKGNNAIEIKTIVRGENPKITMHPDSKKRKLDFAQEHKFNMHTVVIDSQKNIIYYRSGVGSFRLSNMQQVSYRQLVDIIK